MEKYYIEGQNWLNMKIFLSWSEERSKKIAEEFKNFLGQTCQQAITFFSFHDIESGTNWANKLMKELEQTNIGLFFFTPENLKSTFMHFEAGGLLRNEEKTIENGKIIPVLFGIKKSDIVQPFAMFHMVIFNKVEIFKLINEINDKFQNPVKNKFLESIFEKFYPETETEIQKIMDSDTTKPKPRPIEELLDELILNTRNHNSRLDTLDSKAKSLMYIAEQDANVRRRLESSTYSNPEKTFRFNFHQDQLNLIIKNMKSLEAKDGEIRKFINAIPDKTLSDELLRMYQNQLI